jgi:hypothetical protein
MSKIQPLGFIENKRKEEEEKPRKGIRKLHRQLFAQKSFPLMVQQNQTEFHLVVQDASQECMSLRASRPSRSVVHHHQPCLTTSPCAHRTLLVPYLLLYQPRPRTRGLGRGGALLAEPGIEPGIDVLGVLGEATLPPLRLGVTDAAPRPRRTILSNITTSFAVSSNMSSSMPVVSV